jgi:hypothetical protein
VAVAVAAWYIIQLFVYNIIATSTTWDFGLEDLIPFESLIAAMQQL